MIIPFVLVQKYDEYRPFVSEAGRRVKETLVAFCEDHGYAFTSRFKTLESVAEKIETGRFRAWSLIDDLFACTVIVPTLSHERTVLEFCRSAFVVRDVKTRGHSRKAPEVFRFDSTRVQARLRRPEHVQPGPLSIYDVRFEIQIKSAFEHAWAVSTHALAYKSDEVDWKRLRLAAQIKATVEQLDTLILGFEQASLNVTESPWPELESKRQFAVITEQLFDKGHIPSELRPKDISRFCDNMYSLLRSADKDKHMNEVLLVIESEVQATGADVIPRSISLFQFFFAILVGKGLIRPPVRDYTFHVTPDLVELYPVMKDITPVFDYGA